MKTARLLCRMSMYCSVVLLVCGGATMAAPLPAPDWTGIFSPDGRVLNLEGGRDAFFMEDKISDGMGVDMSVRMDTVMSIHDNSTGSAVVDNGGVSAAADLGNGYVWATTDTGGNDLYYAGVERLSSSQDTFVEFEFNQNVVQVRSGAPWPVYGGPALNDLLVRINFTGGVISSAVFKKWDGNSYQDVLVAASNDDCAAGQCRLSAGAPPMQSTQAEVWDEQGAMVQVPSPDRFVEIGVNVASLLGSNVEFTSIQVRTPEDVILDSFRRIGIWAQGGQGGTQ